MRTTSDSKLRENLSAMLDGVVDDREPLLITRDDGRPSAIIISLDDYASLEETRFLLQNPRNAERLLASTAELEAGRGRQRDLYE